MPSDLDRISSRQLGLITHAQLRRVGLSRSQVFRRVHAEVLIAVRRNVYRLAGAPVTWEQAVLAAALAAGSGAVVSHATAAAIWRLKHSDRHTAGIHITRPTRIRLEGVTSHRNRLAAADRTRHGAIPITTRERTILDLVGTLSEPQLAECVDDALRRGLISLERLRILATRASGSGRRLVTPMHAILAERLPGYRPGDSDWEKEMDRLWDELGLPEAKRQYEVEAAGRRYRIDRAILALRIGVEWEGFAWHGSTRTAFDKGSDRRADLTAEGWHMMDFTAKSTPERIVAAVRRAVEERRLLNPPKAS